MKRQSKLIMTRLLPLVLVTLAAAVWFNDVQDNGPYVLRNLLPPGVVLGLAYVALRRGGGSWSAGDWRWTLGTLGFAIPALGLSIYLHYAYSVNLNGMFSNASTPDQLFRFLPVYTVFAGAIGFVIGWIVGRNL